MGINEDTFLKCSSGSTSEPCQGNFLPLERNIRPLFPLIPVSTLLEEEFLPIGCAGYIQICIRGMYIDAYARKPSYAMVLS